MWSASVSRESELCQFLFYLSLISFGSSQQEWVWQFKIHVYIKNMDTFKCFSEVQLGGHMERGGAWADLHMAPPQQSQTGPTHQ